MLVWSFQAEMKTWNKYSYCWISDSNRTDIFCPSSLYFLTFCCSPYSLYSLDLPIFLKAKHFLTRDIRTRLSVRFVKLTLLLHQQNFQGPARNPSSQQSHILEVCSAALDKSRALLLKKQLSSAMSGTKFALPRKNKILAKKITPNTTLKIRIHIGRVQVQLHKI